MAEPVSPQKAPYPVELQPGVYSWCRCGRSQHQPFCDGSHKGTQFRPMVFTITAAEKKWLCGCKHTGTPPFCDDTHKKL